MALVASIARDGASNLEVVLRLQKELNSIGYFGSTEIKELAISNSHQAYESGELTMRFRNDREMLKYQYASNINS